MKGEIKNDAEIPTVDEMRKKALEIADSIPNLKEKHKFMISVRGDVIELSIIIETCFNQLITGTGKEMVFDHENKELHLIKGIRDKKGLQKFKTKSEDMKKLIRGEFPNLEDGSESKLLDALERFEADRKSTRLNSSHTDISRMPSSA